jgi:hypothetical protein
MRADILVQLLFALLGECKITLKLLMISQGLRLQFGVVLGGLGGRQSTADPIAYQQESKADSYDTCKRNGVLGHCEILSEKGRLIEG